MAWVLVDGGLLYDLCTVFSLIDACQVDGWGGGPEDSINLLPLSAKQADPEIFLQRL